MRTVEAISQVLAPIAAGLFITAIVIFNWLL